MAGQLRLDDPEALRTFAAGVTVVRGALERLGTRGHTVLDLLPDGAGAMPAGLRQAIVDLWTANEEKVGELAGLGTGIDRTLAALAHLAASVAVRLPGADATSAVRLGTLVDEAAADVPAPPDRDARDPRFVSPVRNG